MADNSNSILGNYHACWCALPAMNGGSTECCKHCANNPWRDKDPIDEWKKFKFDPDEIKRGRMEVEFGPDGKIIKITYYN